MDNKNVFANNLRKQMELKGKSRNDICQALGISYFTVSDWVNGKKYPRMDKVEMLAAYFGILKSDLIEDKKETKEKTPDKIELTEGEKLLLELFRQIPEDAQKMYLEVLKNKIAALTAENDLLRLKLEHKEEIISLHNYYNKLKSNN